MTTTPGSERALLADACERIGPAVRGAVDEALGTAEIVASCVALEGDVARVFVLGTGAFVLVEVTRTGDRLVVTVPVWRIRRVLEARVGGVTTVTVELDADRSVQRTDANGTTIVLPAGYDMSAATGLDESVLRFAAAARSALLAG
jgi:hypothetical protein